jgi:hypothetical protein
MKATGAAPVVAQSDEDATQEARITQLTAPDIVVMLVLMIGIGIIVLYYTHWSIGNSAEPVRRSAKDSATLIR